MREDKPGILSVFLCGDVMTGRGIDQALPHPGNPLLYESCVRDSRHYVELAEQRNGPLQRPVSFGYIWGDALAELNRLEVDVRIINLETAITRSNECWPDKGIHYRMNPPNVGCLTSARVTACSLANNHVLDWGYAGLKETIQTLDGAGIARAGAGENARDAAAPAVVDVAGKGRVLLFSFGAITSGIPRDWAAAERRAGVNLLEDLSDATARRAAGWMRQFQKKDDLVIASIHWGDNWGYEIPREHIAFAHRLIDEGVAIVHGHSSHHARAIEVYRDRLILYGCGDFLTDYEGIAGYEEFRNDLALMYLVQLNPEDGRLAGARLVPMQMRCFQLKHALPEDARWLAALLNRISARFDTQIQSAGDGSFILNAFSSIQNS